MYKLSKEIGNNFCYAPWTNIHINPQGQYKLCCAGSTPLGDLRKTSLNDIVNSRKVLEIKTKIINNEYHENCKLCVNDEQRSSSSERDWYNDIAENQIIEVENLQDQHLQNLDIRWSTTCNLSCVYCSHDASSTWAMLKNIPQERIDYSNTINDFLNFIDANKKTLKNLGLLGGEPLLQKENELLLDVVDSDVHINVITNLSVPLEKNKIFNKLLEKNKVVWDISFETIEDKFEYVRHGSSWELITKNIRYLQDKIKDRPGHLIGITGQFSIYNALDLSKVNQYFYENNFPQPRWHELTYPEVLSVVHLPNRFIKKSIVELENSIKFINWHKQKKFLQEMSASLAKIDSQTENCDSLLAWHKHQEKTYWPDFKYKFEELWPEYLE
jgi:MoaA/NifB/PqqE/SkfB family radical SAM enzyme